MFPKQLYTNFTCSILLPNSSRALLPPWLDTPLPSPTSYSPSCKADLGQRNPKVLLILFPTAFALTKSVSPVSSVFSLEIKTLEFLLFYGFTLSQVCTYPPADSSGGSAFPEPLAQPLAPKTLQCSRPRNSLFPLIFRVQPNLSAQISARSFSQQPHNFLLQFWPQLGHLLFDLFQRRTCLEQHLQFHHFVDFSNAIWMWFHETFGRHKISQAWKHILAAGSVLLQLEAQCCTCCYLSGRFFQSSIKV